MKALYKNILLIAVVALLGATACGDNNKVNPDPTPTPTPVTPGSDPVLAELKETAINGTTLASTTTVAGLISDTKTGKGIEGVAVTDGYTVVKTDANGVYQLVFNKLARKVYYTTPSAYEVALNSKSHLPAFFSPGNMQHGKKYRVDFQLAPLTEDENSWTLLAIGDPQCSATAEYARYRAETITDITKVMSGTDHSKRVYAVTLGDITFDSNVMWESMASSMSNIQANGRYIPFFQCMGNHDHNALVVNTGDDHATMMYKTQQNFFDHFGPCDYSFDRGNAHIVVMDNVWVTSTKTTSKSNGYTCVYSSGYTPEQLAWFRADLAAVKNPENKVLIFCGHIPFRAGGSSSTGSSVNKDKNYANMLTAMKVFGETHIMIGHTHYQQNYIHSAYQAAGGKPFYEHIHGAACGAWWSAKSNVTGGPNGYNIYDIEGGSVKNWVYKGTDRNPNYQLRVYDGNQEYTGKKGYKLKWFNVSALDSSMGAKAMTQAEDAFVAEVFDDDNTNWTVELWQDGQKVGDFKRVADGNNSNVAITSFWFNEKSKNTDTWTNKTASHYWYYKPTSGKPATEKNWEVRATQTIPSSGVVKKYTCNKLTTDYSEF